MNKNRSHQKLPPVWIVRIFAAFRRSLMYLHGRLFPGSIVLYEQFQSFWVLPSLYVAAKLDLAGTLRNGPLNAEELAEKTGTHAPSLFRIMRALASSGIFSMDKKSRFRVNRISRYLLNDPGNLRHMLIHHLGPVNWNVMSHLEHTLKTGKDAFSDLYGKGIYDYLRENHDEYMIFDQSMTNLTSLGLGPVLQVYDFSGSSPVADIGGGEGFLLSAILASNPGVKGILFDLPEALGKSQALYETYGITDRVTTVEGDFFTSALPEASLYLLKNILHNWNDEKCIELLSNIRKVMKAGSRILIIEMIVSDGDLPSLAKLLDIQMLATMPGGRERTLEEFVVLLKKSGLRKVKVHATVAPLSLIEAGPLP